MILARRIVERYGDTTIVFGGPHATLDPGSILEYVPSAVVVSGDGLGVIPKLVRRVPLEDIPGTYVYDNGEVVCPSGQRVNAIHDVNTFPVIDRSIFANEPFEKHGRMAMTVVSSYGCGGRCAFCITPAQWEIMKTGGIKRVRFRDMRLVVEECKSLVEEHGVNHIQFIDDEMIPHPKRANLFLSLWEEAGLAGKVTFNCLIRPDTIARFGRLGILSKLKSAGLERISLGIETGYERGCLMVSNRNGKLDPKYNPDNILSGLNACREEGIATKGFLMLGLPGETVSETRQTVDFMHSLKKFGLGEVALFPVKVYPGTALWDMAIAHGHTEEDLGHYSAPRVRLLIVNGMNPVVASRDGYMNTAQLAEYSNKELSDICYSEMNAFSEL
ncbi:hypothetical protein DRH14_00440 [Candidatus Shapirobacteria bacterium]|nr:MAG: hypothetical protein DRH14_00440 [Candidatus Shapirobacteria bacterium]